ncbi:universal stress protein [Fodinicola acaciae]|uniref:universal stress protein n=1 Tax=Fodinicola acaciae TaxID=2681555 RepID=UPI0013D64211|nr:universal stress protein [Fodinicola acaciae]
MSPISRRPVSVGVDGSAAAMAAVGWAAAEASWRKVSLRLVHALFQIPTGLHPKASEADRRRVSERHGQRILDAASHRASAVAPEVELLSQLARVSSAAALVSASTTSCLVVVGTDGSGQASSALLGSTVAAAITQVQCPVAIVPPDRPPRTAGGIVVGVDYDHDVVHPHVRAAVDYAFEAAVREGSRLLALHAWNDLSTEPTPGMVIPILVDWKRLATRQRSRLATALQPWMLRFPQVKVDFVTTTGPARRALVELSRTAGTVVLGSRGSGGVAGLPLGSVARTVLHSGHCPVVVVHDVAGGHYIQQTAD